MSSGSRRSISWLSTILMGLSVVLAACASGTTPSQGNGTMVIRMPDDYDTLDPATTLGFDMGNTLRALLYDRLVEVDEHGNVVPHLATSWEVSPSSATLHLRTDATCSDGSKLKPSDVAASIQRLGDPATKSHFAYRTFGGAGLASATADDGANTVTIALKEPYSDLMLGLAMSWASVICKAGLASPDQLATKAFGTGPYTLTESKRGDSYTLARRDNYKWGPQGSTEMSSSSPAKIVLREVQSETTAANLLLSGDVNAAFFTGADTDRVAANTSLNRYEVQDNGGYGTQFNELPGLPGASVTFRHAIEAAIDPQAFNKAATFGHGKFYKTLYSPNLPCYNSADGANAPTYDVNAAKSLLQQDGWAPGADGKLAKNGKPYTLRLVGYADENSGPDYMLDALQKLGFNVTLRKPDVNGWVDIVYTTGDYDIDAYGYSSRFPSPGLFAGQVKQAHIDNQDYFTNVASAQQATQDQKCKFWDAAEVALISRYDSMNLAIPVFEWFSKGYKLRAPNELLWPTSIQST